MFCMPNIHLCFRDQDVNNSIFLYLFGTNIFVVPVLLFIFLLYFSRLPLDIVELVVG